MNCKPGDLAVIVSSLPEYGPWLGLLVRVVDSKVSPYFKQQYWTYEGPRIRIGGWEAGGIEDKYLRPIRDPGEDARDETLSWLPVPSRTTEAA